MTKSCAHFFVFVIIMSGIAVFAIVPPVIRGTTPGHIVADTYDIDLGELQSEDGSEARFKLWNVGGDTVRVKSIASSCGCTIVEVDRKIFPPGAMGHVVARIGRKLNGTVTANVVVETDSEVTPYVNLTIRSASRKEPPFVVKAVGDLHFAGGRPEGDIGSITITTVETSRHTKRPIIINKIECLEISDPEIDDSPLDGEGVVQRVYTYKARLLGNPADWDMVGLLQVVDPWDNGKTFPINVTAEGTNSFRIVPREIQLRLINDIAHTQSQFVIIASHSNQEFLVHLETCDHGESLHVEEVSPGSRGRVRIYRVTLTEGTVPGPGSCKLSVSVIGKPDERADIPLSIAGDRT